MHLPPLQWLVEVFAGVGDSLLDVLLVCEWSAAIFTASVACFVHGAADCRGAHIELTFAGQFRPFELPGFPIFCRYLD